MNEETNIKEKQPLIFQQIQNSFKNNRLAHAYLFEGPTGTGKALFGQWAAKAFMCLENTQGSPCNQCVNCRRIEADEHPDVLNIQPEGQTIKVEQIRYVKSEFSKSGLETAKKFFIIHHADKMSISAANSMLKFIEEPEGQVLIILTTNTLSKVLPTIQSRCQVLHFKSLNKRQFLEQLLQADISRQSAELLVELTGSFEKAVEFSQDEWFNEAKEIIQQWFAYLRHKDLQALIYIQKKMVKHFKEKEQQAMSFDLLLAFLQKELKRMRQNPQEFDKIQDIAKMLEVVLKGKQKWEAHVSWQSVSEQMVIRMMNAN